MTQDRAQEIDQAAADWAAKVDRGLTAQEQAELDRWLDGDARRIGAYGRMRAIALQTERVAALGPVHSPRDFTGAARAEVSRRRLLTVGSAVAAGLAGAGAVGWSLLMRGHYQTRKGETRQLALSDGSVVTLNTASKIAVRLTRHVREVRLLVGEALFDVAHDAARPFVVLSGATRARVLGTSFVVRALPDEAVQVLVREGVVELSRTDAALQRPLRMVANTRAVSAAGSQAGREDAIVLSNVSQSVVARALAWRDGMIDFEGVPLGQAASEFMRYSDTLVVVDPDLAQEEIAGLYQTNDPVGFARAVAASLRAEAKVSGGEVLIQK